MPKTKKELLRFVGEKTLISYKKESFRIFYNGIRYFLLNTKTSRTINFIKKNNNTYYLEN